MNTSVFDVAIIGGGVNGCGIARDAAGRGLSVFLCEQHDLGGGTSSASTKLIHGGLRYLEYYEFRLVREALAEREVLLKAAPHIIRPLRFILPHHRGLRPAWLIRFGLFLYDHLGGRKLLAGTSTVDLTSDEAGTPLKGDFRKGFEYSDCWVFDSRLVVLNAVDAAEHGAEIHTRTACLGAKRQDGLWTLNLLDGRTGERRQVRARTLVNASGPWMDKTLATLEHRQSGKHLRLVKGSHIIVPKLFAHARAYLFQNEDGRIIFAIPYEHRFTLIGTTDVDFDGDPSDAAISREETDYLCRAASEYFTTPVTPEMIVDSFSGVRPLFDDGKNEARAATRDYFLQLEAAGGTAPLLLLYGGKITTYRKLAEAALDKLAPYLPGMGRPWTAGAFLPGGEFLPERFSDEVQRLLAACPLLGRDHATRLVRGYGTRALAMTDRLKGSADLGHRFGADLYEFEVRYLRRHEWARTADDILRRRTNLGLVFSHREKEALQAWLEKEQM